MPISKEDIEKKCLMCEVQPPHSLGWTYVWKGQGGYMCEECGKRFYEIGNYLNEAASKAMQAHGIHVSDTKDKFGGWRIYWNGTDEDEKFVRELQRVYETMFPEFSWEWD